jgi:hypothetical protein
MRQDIIPRIAIDESLGLLVREGNDYPMIAHPDGRIGATMKARGDRYAEPIVCVDEDAGGATVALVRFGPFAHRRSRV